MTSAAFWRGRRVLVTGHTGFKGGWLCLWLRARGAEVHGFSLDPPTTPSLYEACGLGERIASDLRGDVADLHAVEAAFAASNPEIVFHLAAQSLVRAGYADPFRTVATNVLGTASVLEAARRIGGVRALVLATTDKVYDNREWPYAYRETDRLGGHEPYGASKAAAEIVASGLRAAFFRGEDSARVATVRAGNVIGGGDFARDRLLPDCLAAFEAGEPIRLRYPRALRPWQHVLEPLSGYLALAERLCAPDGANAAQAWNFGPDARDEVSVETVARIAAGAFGGRARVELVPEPDAPAEAGLLRIDSTLARGRLHWHPRWRLEEAVSRTVAWRKSWRAGADAESLCLAEIAAYEEEATP